MKLILAPVAALLIAGCAAQELGEPAEIRPGPNGESVHYYPQLPYGHVTYAFRYGSDGKLIAKEQRLTEENIAKVEKGRSTSKQVRDLLGPPYQPVKQERMERDIWTYPMRIAGYPTPKWFVVQMSYDGVVRETYLLDDPRFHAPDSTGSIPR